MNDKRYKKLESNYYTIEELNEDISGRTVNKT